MNISFDGVTPDQYEIYRIPYTSKILGKTVSLCIPTYDGEGIQGWQLALAQLFSEREEHLEADVYQNILAYYLDQLDDLQAQFSAASAHLIPRVETIDQLKKLLTPTGIYIGSLEPDDEAIGLLFECTWEEEHGLGVRINNWQVAEVSHQDVAFSI